MSNSYVILALIVIIPLLIGLGIIFYSTEEKNKSAQIELANCDDLKSLYTQYNSSRFKEKIKSKYIFDCVADKNSLEFLK